MKTLTLAAILAGIALAGPVRAEEVATATHTRSVGDRTEVTTCRTSQYKSGKLHTNCSTYSYKRVAWKDSVMGRKARARKIRRQRERAEQEAAALEARSLAAVKVWYEPIEPPPALASVRGPL